MKEAIEKSVSMDLIKRSTLCAAHGVYRLQIKIHFMNINFGGENFERNKLQKNINEFLSSHPYLNNFLMYPVFSS